MDCIAESPLIRTGKNARGSRNILTAAQALEIFGLKDEFDSSAKTGIKKASAKKIATLYGVSGKTVNDIWIGRTWFRTTHVLDPNRKDAMQRLEKRPGRPKGAKDRKPRIRLSGLNMAKPMLHCMQQHSMNSEIIPIWENMPEVDDDYQIIQRTDERHRVRAEAHFELNMGHKISSGPESESTNRDFIDPFHDDWPYW